MQTGYVILKIFGKITALVDSLHTKNIFDMYDACFHSYWMLRVSDAFYYTDLNLLVFHLRIHSLQPLQADLKLVIFIYPCLSAYVGGVCSTNTDCFDQHTVCTSSRCQCDANHLLEPSTSRCLGK